jgi:excinuclease UvrABC nuclease subunit
MSNLYRHFDKDNRLLYVGVSLSVTQRLAQHRSHAHWFSQITRVEVEQFLTRQEAIVAERAAIKNERPLFNIQFSEQRSIARAEARKKRNIIATAIQGTIIHPAATEKSDEFWHWRALRRVGAQ